MQTAHFLRTLLQPTLKNLGYEIVRVQVSPTRKPAVQVMIEREDEKSVTLEDCTKVSHTVSALFDVEDPFKSPYVLEVTSPGLDRPLIEKKDYHRFCGQTIKLKTHQGIHGQKRFQGLLKACQPEGIVMGLSPDVEMPVHWDNIQEAKLVPHFEKGKKN